MNVLLAAVLLMQDKPTVDPLTTLEAAVNSAKTISFSFTEHAAVTRNGSVEISSVTTGTFLLKAGGKVSIAEEFVDTAFGVTSKGRLNLVSDGSGVNVVTPAKVMSGRTPDKMEIFLRKSLTRFRVQMISYNLSTAVESPDVFKNAETFYEPLKVLSVHEVKGNKVLDCSLTFSLPPVHAKVKLFCDPTSSKLLRRTWEIPESGATRSVDETFTEFILNADISDEKFKLPEEKK